MNIQEIAEELVNLSVKEVNELSMVLKNENDSQANFNYKMYDPKMSNYNSSPKKYCDSLRRNKRRR